MLFCVSGNKFFGRAVKCAKEKQERERDCRDMKDMESVGNKENGVFFCFFISFG